MGSEKWIRWIGRAELGGGRNSGEFEPKLGELDEGLGEMGEEDREVATGREETSGKWFEAF